MQKNAFDISGELGFKRLKAVNREVARIFTGVYNRDAKPHMYIGDRHIYMKSIEKIADILFMSCKVAICRSRAVVRHGCWQFRPRAWVCVDEWHGYVICDA